MPSIFSKIINGEIPCYKIAEDDNHFAFLDIRPLAVGHTLVVPKKEIDYIYDMEDTDFANLHVFAKKVAQAIKDSVECIRVGTLVIGTEVPHAHIHLIPFIDEKQMAITSEKLSLDRNQMVDIAQRINRSFSSL